MIEGKQWIAWLGATLIASVTMCAFVYSNFETVDHAKETRQEFREMLQEVKADVKELLRRSE